MIKKEKGGVQIIDKVYNFTSLNKNYGNDTVFTLMKFIKTPSVSQKDGPKVIIFLGNKNSCVIF